VEEQTLREVLGVDVRQIGKDDLIPSIAQVADSEISEEIAIDRARFVADIDDEVHERSVRIGLGLRRYLEEGQFGAFSMNFLAFDSAEEPVNAVPFLEASKAMARGLGYAGEGDVLTAALVGALSQGFGKTTFTEIFCPDWEGGSLFLSHMGEINPAVAAEKPRLCEKDFPWGEALNPAVITCAPAAGPAVLVNLAPGPDDTFGLIVAPVTVLGDATNETLKDSVRGWIRPSGSLEEFLEVYSRHGGTHHSALVTGEKAEAVGAFGRFVGIDVVMV
jgi:L-arabinose isomerase